MNPKVIRCKDPQNFLTIRQMTHDITGLCVPNQLAAVEKQAFDQGFQEGERAAKRLYESKAEAAAKRYDQSVAEMITAYRTLVAAAERNAVQLAMAIARKVIQRELHIEPSDVAGRAAEALAAVHTHPGIALKVSVQDAARLRQMVAQINPSAIVQEDPSMKPGDFIIDTSQTHLDGRIESQLEEIEQRFLEE